MRVQATGTTTAGVIRLFVKPSGGTYLLWKEILVTAITPSTTVEAWSAEYIPVDPLALAASAVLGASTNAAETFNVFANSGDF